MRTLVVAVTLFCFLLGGSDATRRFGLEREPPVMVVHNGKYYEQTCVYSADSPCPFILRRREGQLAPERLENQPIPNARNTMTCYYLWLFGLKVKLYERPGGYQRTYYFWETPPKAVP